MVTAKQATDYNIIRAFAFYIGKLMLQIQTQNI